MQDENMKNDLQKKNDLQSLGKGKRVSMCHDLTNLETTINQ